MSTTRHLVAGDRGATDDFEFVGVADLLGVTATVGHVWRTTGDRDAHDVEVEVLDGATRMCRVHWGDSLDDWLPSQITSATWRFEVEASWPEKPAITSPSRAPIYVKVRADGDTIPEV